VQGLVRCLTRHSQCNPNRSEPKRIEPNRTAWVARSSTDAPVMTIQFSWQPNPLVSLRDALDTSCRVAVVVRTELLSSDHSRLLNYFRRITLVSSRSLRNKIKYMTFCAWIDQTSYASFALQTEQSRIEPNRTAWAVRSSTDPPFLPLLISWQPNPFVSLRDALDTSCRVAVVVRIELLSSDHSRRVAFFARKY